MLQNFVIFRLLYELNLKKKQQTQNQNHVKHLVSLKIPFR